MAARSVPLTRALFYGRLGLVYGLTVWAVVVVFHPAGLLAAPHLFTLTAAERPLPPPAQAISGRPVRIVISSEHVDLPVDPGYYNPADGSWTLSGYRAQFAMVSSLANNLAGNTFIYGHNNNYVFGALRHHTPNSGAIALLYTANHHIFAYSFVNATSVGPTDVNVLNYRGPSLLTIQTCTGSLNEWRTMYRFRFTELVQ
ncbi:MAG TPA: sortase [Candidatus Saccharimonadales bacterium]|nr:sortase [Candidatus Saccharimonadales bacterium]